MYRHWISCADHRVIWSSLERLTSTGQDLMRNRPMVEEARRFAPAPLLRWLLVPAGIAGIALVLGEVSDVDRTLVRLFYDPLTASFPLRTTFWFDVVMHHWAKYLVAAVGGVVVARYVLSWVRPGLRRDRRLLLFLVLAITLAPLSVTIGKAVSDRHCPWDVEDFGGAVPYTTFLEPIARNVKPGHCFPAGHASTGFTLMAFYFAAYARGRRHAARWLLALGVGAGVLLGLGRVAQGAHFPSHVVWSGVMCWMVMVILYVAIMRSRRRSEIGAL